MVLYLMVLEAEQHMQRNSYYDARICLLRALSLRHELFQSGDPEDKQVEAATSHLDTCLIRCSSYDKTSMPRNDCISFWHLSALIWVSSNAQTGV